MADPRNTVSYDGIDYQAETFLTDNTIVYDSAQANGAAQVGLAVTITGAGTVGLVADAQRVYGKLLKVESDGKATVQTDGYVTLPAGASAAVTAGKGIVGALGASSAKGYIRDAAANSAEAIAAGDSNIVDPTTTTAVVVNL